MARQEDRAKIKLGPARFDSPKAIRDRIAETIQETPATALVGGVTIDQVQDAIDNYVPVTGGVGQVIGIPPGTPFVYVPANLATNPADLIALGWQQYELVATTSTSGREALRELYVYAQDTANVLGLGSATVMNSDGTTLYAYSPSNGTSLALGHPSIGLNTSNRPINADNKIVLGRNRVTSTETSYTTQVYDGSSWAGATFTLPANTYHWGTGECTNTARVCVVGGAGTSTVTSVRVSEYSATGGTNLATNDFALGASINQSIMRAKVENGWAVVYDSPSTADPNVFVGPANATSTNVWRQLSFPGARYFGPQGLTIGPTGIGFAAYRDSGGNIDFAKFDANTGTVTVYASVLDGVIQAVFSGYGSSVGRLPVSFGLAYANDNNCALTGMLASATSGTIDRTPTYLMIDVTGGVVSISATYFNTFTETTSTVYHACMNPVRLSGGDIVFVVNDAQSPLQAFLYQVAGP
jgi:hypothetical protein